MTTKQSLRLSDVTEIQTRMFPVVTTKQSARLSDVTDPTETGPRGECCTGRLLVCDVRFDMAGRKAQSTPDLSHY